jgi:hypothetical protein
MPAFFIPSKMSVFDIMNIFHSQWFINKDHLIANILSAQKDKGSQFTWVDFMPPFHTHLVQHMHVLLPPLCPMAKGKHVMFIFLMEVLSGEGPDPWVFWKVLKKHCSCPQPSAKEKTPDLILLAPPVPNLALSTGALLEGTAPPSPMEPSPC